MIPKILSINNCFQYFGRRLFLKTIYFTVLTRTSTVEKNCLGNSEKVVASSVKVTLSVVYEELLSMVEYSSICGNSTGVFKLVGLIVVKILGFAEN